MDEKNKERLDWLDLVRSAAILFVVLCHVAEINLFYSNINVGTSSLLFQLTAFTLFTFGRLGVPLFLFISGYLLLPRQYDDQKCFRFWKRNLLTLFILTEIWIIIYQLYLTWLHQTDFQWAALLQNMLFLRLTDLPHIWYLPMILGLYLSLPFVSAVLKKFSWKVWCIPLIIVAVFSFTVPTLNILLNLFGYPSVSTPLDFGFLGSIYGIFLIFGYVVYKESAVNIIKRYALRKYFVIATGLFFALTVYAQIYIAQKGTMYTVWYTFPPLALTAAFLFLSLKNCRLPGKLALFFQYVSKYSFGIFLVHFPVMELLQKYIPWNWLPVYGKIAIVLLLTLICSWCIVAVFSKIPKVGKFLFLVK